MPTFWLDALVILRAKVNRGAKSWCPYRCGYCARAPMRLGAEAEEPALLALERLPLPPSFFRSWSNSLAARSPHLDWACCLPGSSQYVRLPLPLAGQVWRPYPVLWFRPSPLGVASSTDVWLWQTSTCPPYCMHPSVLWLAYLGASEFPQRTPWSWRGTAPFPSSTPSSRRFSFRRVTFLALSKRLLTAAPFALARWWKLKCRYLTVSVYVGFLKIVMSRVSPSLRVRKNNTSPLPTSRRVIPYPSSSPFPLPYRNHRHHQRKSWMRNQITKDPGRMRGNNHWQSSHTWVVWVSGSGKASEKFDLWVVFKSGPTLRSLLTKVKDRLPKEKLAGVFYQIPCQCGKVYIGEMQRHLETRVKEHRDACNKGDMWQSGTSNTKWTRTEPEYRIGPPHLSSWR